MFLRVTATVILIIMLAHINLRVTSGLTCYKCTNWDNSSKCLDPDPKVDTHGYITIEECDPLLEVGKRKAYCLTEILYECQPMIFKSSFDYIGNGGGVMKRWVRFSCAYINPNREPFKSHSECNWQRERSGRDVYHNESGFQVIGRSSIHRKCFCNDEDQCNLVRYQDSVCDQDCGPKCEQVSRDRCTEDGGIDDNKGKVAVKKQPKGDGGKKRPPNMPKPGDGGEESPPDMPSSGGDQPSRHRAENSEASNDNSTDYTDHGDYDEDDGDNDDGENDYDRKRRRSKTDDNAVVSSDSGTSDRNSGRYKRQDDYIPPETEDAGSDCKCPASVWPEERDQSFEPKEREWPDCGMDEGRMVATMVGGRTFRHYWRRGVRKAIVIGEEKNSSWNTAPVNVSVLLFTVIMIIIR